MGWSCRSFLLSCFCCNALPNFSWISKSTCTRAVYVMIYFTCLILLLVAVHVPKASRNLPFCKDDDTLLCREYSSFPAVYRICFTYALFFTVMCVCTFGISSSRSYRSVIHNGFWFFKFAFIGLILVGSAYIPHGLFDEIFMYFGLMFVFTFNLFEMFVFVQLIRDLTLLCRVYCFKQASACTKFIATFFALLLQGAGTGIFVLVYFVYSHCVINLVFSIVNMCLSHMISLGSFFLKLQKKDWNSILEGSVLTSHVMFITWSSITNNPRNECNSSHELADLFSRICNFTFLTVAGIAVFFAVEFFIRNWVKEKPNSVVYLEERGRELCGIWGKRKLVQVIQPENTTTPAEDVTYKSTDPDDDEYDHVKYFWHAMHNVFLQAVFCCMISFTNNYMYSTSPAKKIFHNEAAMWFKIVSSWLCMLSFVFIEFLPQSTRAHITEPS